MTGLDVAFRVGTVFQTYKEGGNWQKEAGIQAVGYATGEVGKNISETVTRGALRLIKFDQAAAGVALEMSEGVALVVLAPEIVVILISTAASYEAETYFEKYLRQI